MDWSRPQRGYADIPAFATFRWHTLTDLTRPDRRSHTQLARRKAGARQLVALRRMLFPGREPISLPDAAVFSASGETLKNLFTCGSQSSQPKNHYEALFLVGRWWPLFAAPDFSVLVEGFWERNRKMSDTRTFSENPSEGPNQTDGELSILPPLIGDDASFTSIPIEAFSLFMEGRPWHVYVWPPPRGERI